MTSKIRNIVAIALGLIALASAGYGGVCYFATASEVSALAYRLDIKILTDQRDYIQRRIWEIEDRYKYGGMTAITSQQLRDLKIQLINIDRQIQQLTKGG